MKNTLRLSIVLFVAASLLMVDACKKTTPTVAGDWMATNISGSYTSGSNSLTSSYNNTLKTLSQITVQNGQTTPLSVPYTLELNISSNGTYLLTETYTVGTNPQTVNKVTGTWTESSNNILTLSGLDYTGVTNGNNYLFNSAILANSGTVATLTGNQLVWTFNSSSSSGGVQTTTSYTLTFAK